MSQKFSYGYIIHMTTKEAKICPACQHENQADASICEKCKRVLGNITTAVTFDEGTELASKAKQVSGKPKVSPGMLTLLFPGEANPLTLEIKDELVLGRSVPGGPAPDIDLLPYGAPVLGVSRTHAVIRFSDDEASVVDQGSSNGTWVNQKHIAPYTIQKLRSGDLLRLGNMLIFAYFSSAPPTKKTILLANVSKRALLSQQQNLSMADLNDKIIPYLNSIFEIQAVLDQNSENQSSQIGIDYIGWSEAHRGIQVRLQGVDKLVEFLNTKLRPAEQNTSKNNKPNDGEPAQAAPFVDTKTLTDKTQTSEESSPEDQGNETQATAPKDLPQTDILIKSRPSAHELAQELLAELGKNIPELAQINLRKKIMPHLDTLLTSTFELHIIRIS